MPDLDRRDALKLGAAAVAAAVLPPMPAAAAPVAPPVPAPPACPMWVVGTPGEHDAQAIAAPDARTAFVEWRESLGAVDPDGNCEWCGKPEVQCGCDVDYYTTRVKQWDGRDPDDLEGGDWVDAGFGCICDRCGYEMHSWDGHNIEGEAVCDGCMTLADWRMADPQRHAELLEETLIEEYGI